MSYKMFVVVFNVVILLPLATGTLWANEAIVPTAKNPSAQHEPFIHDDGAGLCNIRHDSTGVAASCTTGSFDAILRRTDDLASRHTQTAPSDVSLISRQLPVDSTQTHSLVSLVTGQASPLPPNENSTGTAHYEGAKWNNGPVITWSIADTPGTPDSPFSGYMGSQYEALVQQAFRTWSAASGLTFEEVSDSSQSDIRLGWGYFDTSSTRVVGYTLCAAQAGQFLPNVIIRLEDPSEDSLVAGTGNSLIYSGTNASLYQVILHEIGHALGLADNADPNSVMRYEATGSNDTLDGNDVAGIQALYGSPAVAARTLEVMASELSGPPTSSMIR